MQQLQPRATARQAHLLSVLMMASSSLLVATAQAAEDDTAKMRAMLQANGHVGECSNCHGNNDPNRFKLDLGQSRLVFRADNFGYGPVLGEFRDFEGGFKYDVDKKQLQSVIATVRAGSIDLGDALLNAVVRERFVQADKFPLLTFVATEVKSEGQGRSSVIGELTLLGVTRPIALEVTLARSGEHPQSGMMTVGLSARGSILRSDYGLTLGGPAIGDEISFEIVAIGSRAR